MATQTNSHPLPPHPAGAPQHIGFHQAQEQPAPQDQYQQHYQQQYPQHNQQYQQYQQYQQPQAQPQAQAQAQAYHQQKLSQSSQASNPKEPPASRQRPKSRSKSFLSDKSSHKGPVLNETHAEKEAKRLHSKADPTLAMQEAEPATVAAGAPTSLASIRNMAHMDSFGNPIVDADLSNPSRYRWEKPLDTIRRFEAAIDDEYNRKSMMRSDSDSAANWNRRSSFYGGPNNNTRFSRDSYYGGRPGSMMPSSSQLDLRSNTLGREGYFDQQSGYYGVQSNGSRRFSRMASEPHHVNGYRQQGQGVYPTHGVQRSYETVASGSGSGYSGDPAGYQTDPTSSDNSSVDRVQPPQKRPVEATNDYGIGFNQSANYQPPAFSVGQQNGGLPGVPRQAYGAPPVPQKQNTIKGRLSRQQTKDSSLQRPEAGEKRKSWFSRRFSKAN